MSDATKPTASRRPVNPKKEEPDASESSGVGIVLSESELAVPSGGNVDQEINRLVDNGMGKNF